MDCSRPGGFSRQEYWSGLPCPLPGDRPNPGIEPRSPSLPADSLPTELSGKRTYLPRPKFLASRLPPYRLYSPLWEPAPGMKGVGRQDENSQWKTSLCEDSNRVCSSAGEPHQAAGTSSCAGGHLPLPAQNHPPLPSSYV